MADDVNQTLSATPTTATPKTIAPTAPTTVIVGHAMMYFPFIIPRAVVVRNDESYDSEGRSGSCSYHWQ
jgi:hypothetical protein